MHERYSLEVSDDQVLIYGYLSMAEAFAYLSYFQELGYKSIITGEINSALRIMKDDYSLNNMKQLEENNE